MYTKKLIPLSGEDIKKVNATVLAGTFNVSQSYVSRVLKSEKMPTSKSGQRILISAGMILDTYDKIMQLMDFDEEVPMDKIRLLAETYINDGLIETTVLTSKFGSVDLNEVLISFFRYVDAWIRPN